jgi:hypothetical protein
MDLMFGSASGNYRRAACLYQKDFPHRRHPTCKTFAVVDRRLRVTGTLKPLAVNRGNERSIRTPDVEERVLDLSVGFLNVSTRQIATELDVAQVTVLRVLPIPFTASAASQACRLSSTRDFGGDRWFFRQCAEPLLLLSVLFSGEARFGRGGTIRFNNRHQWAEDNSHDVLQCRQEQQFRINV